MVTEGPDLASSRTTTPINDSRIRPRSAINFERPKTADAVALRTAPHEVWGIEGYKAPRHSGMQRRTPDCIFAKDTRKPLYDTKGNPAPNHYVYDIEWESPNYKFKKDHRFRKAKTARSPGPGSYNPPLRRRITGGLLNKCDRVNFLTEVQYVSRSKPSPDKYTPTHVYMPRSTHFTFHQPKKDTNRLKKVDGPGPGSYKYLDAFFRTTPTSKRVLFDKSKKGFTTSGSKERGKSKTPGPG
eukprot:CAMPEP_0115027194 /NCGR_PEP_ID=MMETSP0216-20121206/35321_1 /TAXON_ID=223996 /ORGANISM="Protocruzia adherens, Strain Boccale" /LENGTH=240 /DNA_ID=CAMNT_0002402663 /DNA_START=14 /DNA_END=732 /DNA_ORIENTATION=+